MSIQDLHGLAAKLHQIDEERRRSSAVEDESSRTVRRLAIDLVRHIDNLEERIAKLEGK